MQDNDLDKIFRSKLETFEAEPSTEVWPAIAADLDPSKRRKALLRLSVAASIIVLVTAGLLFVPRRASVSVGHGGKHRTIRPDLPLTKIAPPNIMPNRPALVAQNVAKEEVRAEAKLHRPAPVSPNTSKYRDTVASKPASTSPDDQPLIALTEQNQPGTLKAVVPGEETPLLVKMPPDHPAVVKTEPELTAAVLPVTKKDSVPVKTRHRIHSLGDLVNLVVAKVDKRKDKVIEFPNGEDGEGSIIGVNLGIIKIKKGE